MNPLAVVFLAIGGILVFVALLKGGEQRPWLRGALMEMLYPVTGPLFLVIGIAFLVGGGA